MLDHPAITEIYEKAFPKLFSNFNDAKIRSRGSSRGGNKLSISIGEDQFFNLTPNYDYPSKIISHFTSMSSLFSILNSESIRLYNLDNVNDNNEFLNVLPEKYHDRLKRKKEDIYILSGCDYEGLDEEVKHNMWNLYGNSNEGVRIRLKIEPNENCSYSFLKSVQYDPLDISQYLETISEIRLKYSLDEIDAIQPLLIPSLFHKSKRWALESEKRFVFYDKYPGKYYDDYSNPTTPIFVDYSQRNNCLCRYYNLPLNDPTAIALVTIDAIELGSRYKGDSYKPLLQELGFIALRKKERLGTQFQMAISKI